MVALCLVLHLAVHAQGSVLELLRGPCVVPVITRIDCVQDKNALAPVYLSLQCIGVFLFKKTGRQINSIRIKVLVFHVTCPNLIPSIPDGTPSITIVTTVYHVAQKPKQTQELGQSPG